MNLLQFFALASRVTGTMFSVQEFCKEVVATDWETAIEKCTSVRTLNRVERTT